MDVASERGERGVDLEATEAAAELVVIRGLRHLLTFSRAAPPSGWLPPSSFRSILLLVLFLLSHSFLFVSPLSTPSRGAR